VRDTRQNLEAAANGEHQEWTAGYPELERIARSEGFSEIADFFRHVATVEQRHEHMFQQLLASLDTGEPVKGKTELDSAVDMAEVMLAQEANPAGCVHGGELMKLMDNAAGVVACRHARTNVVTANVEEIDFLQPVRVGDLLLIHAQLTFTSQSSMEVRVEVAAEDILTGRRTPSLAAHYNMVALGPEGKPARVPPLIRSTEAEERLFSEGETRYRGRKERRQHAQ